MSKVCTTIAYDLTVGVQEYDVALGHIVSVFRPDGVYLIPVPPVELEDRPAIGRDPSYRGIPSFYAVIRPGRIKLWPTPILSDTLLIVSIVNSTQSIKAKDDKIARFRAALTKIAAFDDVRANERLAQTGSYSSFDEPGSVAMAREALADFTQSEDNAPLTAKG